MIPPPQPPAPPHVLSIAAGVIEVRGRFLVARRPQGSHAGGTWEFPGGKQRPGEPIEGTLRREILEETGLGFRSAVLLHVEEHSYPDRTVALHFFLCLDPKGEPEGREGQDLKWVTVDELMRLEVPAGNRRFLEILSEHFEGAG